MLKYGFWSLGLLHVEYCHFCCEVLGQCIFVDSCVSEPSHRR